MLEHAARCSGRAQHARQKSPGGAHQFRLPWRRHARRRQAQARAAQHPYEPYGRKHRDGAVQAWVVVELGRIVSRSQSLMFIIEQHRTVAPTMLASKRALSAPASARLLNSEPKPLTMMVPEPAGRIHNTPSPLSLWCASERAKPSRGTLTAQARGG